MDHLPHNTWAEADFFWLPFFFHTHDLPRNSLLSDVILLQCHCTSEAEWGEADGRNAYRVTRVHTCAALCTDPFFSPQVFKRFGWTLTHKNHKTGHWGAAETSWTCTSNTASTFNSHCWKLFANICRRKSGLSFICSCNCSTRPKGSFESARTRGTTSGCSRAWVRSQVDHFVCLLAWNDCVLFNFLTGECKSMQ